MGTGYPHSPGVACTLGSHDHVWSSFSGLPGCFPLSRGLSFLCSNISHHHWKAAQTFDPGALNSPSSCPFAYMQAKSLFLFPE